MKIKPEKKCDGFFTFPVTRTEAIGPDAKQTAEELEQIRAAWDCSVNKYLESIEKRIQELKTTLRPKAGKQTPKLQQHIDEYNDLEQVDGYVSEALMRLKVVRKQLEKGNIEDAIIDTIGMMDAYWMGKIHADYKLSILRDQVHTEPKKTGGKMRGKNKEDAAKPEHDRIRTLAKEINPRLSASAKAKILQDNHGVKLSARWITTILKGEIS